MLQDQWDTKLERSLRLLLSKLVASVFAGRCIRHRYDFGAVLLFGMPFNLQLAHPFVDTGFKAST